MITNDQIEDVFKWVSAWNKMRADLLRWQWTPANDGTRDEIRGVMDLCVDALRVIADKLTPYAYMMSLDCEPFTSLHSAGHNWDYDILVDAENTVRDIKHKAKAELLKHEADSTGQPGGAREDDVRNEQASPTADGQSAPDSTHSRPKKIGPMTEEAMILMRTRLNDGKLAKNRAEALTQIKQDGFTGGRTPRDSAIAADPKLREHFEPPSIEGTTLGLLADQTKDPSTREALKGLKGEGLAEFHEQESKQTDAERSATAELLAESTYIQPNPSLDE